MVCSLRKKGARKYDWTETATRSVGRVDRYGRPLTDLDGTRGSRANCSKQRFALSVVASYSCLPDAVSRHWRAALASGHVHDGVRASYFSYFILIT